MKFNFFLCLLNAFLIFSISAHSQSAVYTLNGGAASQSGMTYSATSADQSSVLVLNSGNLELNNCTMSKSGDGSDKNQSLEYGINSSVLAISSGKITISGGSVQTNALYAAGLFSSGNASSITFKNGSLTTSKDYSSAFKTTHGGSITLKNVTASTSGANSPVLHIDFEGGAISVNGGTYFANATGNSTNSPAIYTSGEAAASSATFNSKGEAGAIVDGGSLSFSDSSLSGNLQAVKIINSKGVGASSSISASGGSLNASTKELFLLSNEGGSPPNANILLQKGISVYSGAGILIKVKSGSAVLTIDGASASGDCAVEDQTSSQCQIILKNSSSLSGKITDCSLKLDSSSVFTATSECNLTVLLDQDGISGVSVNNIIGNGNNVYYDPSNSSNSYLGGLTYSLINGGFLKPVGGGSCSLICDATADPTSGSSPLNVQFQGIIVQNNCPDTPSFFWSFGDGSTSSEQNPSHTYNADGRYNWTMSISTSDQVCEKSGRITVGNGQYCTLVCGAVVEPQRGRPPLNVSFNADVTSTYCSSTPSYLWDFGDGSISSEKSIIHTYNENGTFFYTLTSSADGENCSTTGKIFVSDVSSILVSSVSAFSSPFRLKVFGAGFVEESEIYIDGLKVPLTVFKSSSLLIAKKGSSLKAMIPKGTRVKIEVKNPDGSVSNPYYFIR